MLMASGRFLLGMYSQCCTHIIRKRKMNEKVEKLIEDIYAIKHLSNEDKFIIKMLILKRFGE